MRPTGADGEAAPLSAETFIELPISRTEMADYLGLTIETVSRQIARLRERGILTVGASRAMVIHRPDVLEATVESAPVSERAQGRGARDRDRRHYAAVSALILFQQ